MKREAMYINEVEREIFSICYW